MTALIRRRLAAGEFRRDIEPVLGQVFAAAWTGRGLRPLEYTELDAPTGSAAYKRAEGLLMRFLDDKNRNRYHKCELIKLPGKLGRYEINPANGALYTIRKGLRFYACTDIARAPYTHETLPPLPDRILTKVLWLQADEAGLMAKANLMPQPWT